MQLSRVKRRRPRVRLSLRVRIGLAAIVTIAILLAWAMMARALAPGGNVDSTRVDALIVLGAGLDRDGNPTPTLLARMSETVREYERGVASHIIVSGKNSHGFSQSAAMIRVAVSRGIPASAIVAEPNADDTIQNACYSERIMKQHGWSSAEVITNGTHLPRANLIFSHMPMRWRGHLAPSMTGADGSFRTGDSYQTFLEVLKTMRYVTYARWTESCTP